MKNTPLSLKSVVQSRSQVSSELMKPGDAVLVFRSQPRWLLLKCPCGCHDEIPLNLDWRAGKAWRLYNSMDQELTIFPSVWRDTGCFSHFIIRNGHILLFNEQEEYEHLLHPFDDVHLIAERVKEYWNCDSWVHYLSVADELGEIPWDVLDACRSLVSSGFLLQGRGEKRTFFRKYQSRNHSQSQIPISCD